MAEPVQNGQGPEQVTQRSKPGYISTRDYIKWKPDPASEPTSTLVLTSPARRYIDIRIFKPANASEPELPNEGGPSSRLEWAFAGTSRSQMIPRPDWMPPTPYGDRQLVVHSQWYHWIDSRADGPDEGVSDEGFMWPHPDDEALTLELGRMVNPATGVETEYEECWRDDEAGPVVVLEMKKGGERGVENDKGLVVRVGDWCQGIVKIVTPKEDGGWDSIFCVERWHRQEDGSWERVMKLGEHFLPCPLTWQSHDNLSMGREVTYQGFDWRVVELEGEP